MVVFMENGMKKMHYLKFPKHAPQIMIKIKVLKY